MKKYLMIGFVAAVAFASCSKNDFVTTTQADIDKAKYDQAFRNYIGGAPAANQDWGFGATITRAFTRAGSATIDVNGNEWKTRPEVTPAEAKAVYEYVNRVKTSIPHYSENAPTGLSTYYCTQVWGGKSYGKTYYNDETIKDPNCLYLNATQKLAASKGQNFNDNEKTYGPSHMDNLHIAMSTEDGPISVGANGVLNGYWEHINNFNSSENYNYGGNTGVKNGGTLDFAYRCSEDDKYHDKWIIIDGQYITDEDNVNHAGKYYVCFDFIGVHPEVTTTFHGYFWNERGNNGGEWKYVGPITVSGYYASVADAANVTYDITLDDNVNGGTWTKTVTLVNDAADATVHQAYGIEIEGYDKGNFCYDANEIYTDWIIRLVNAQPVNPNPNVLRIVAEDLTATQASDFDFNDVVLDVTLGNPATVTLVAAGGTLQLKVGSNGGNGGVEVHEALLGAANAKNGNVYKMVSPGGDVWQEGGYAVDITQYITDKDIQTPAAANTKIRIEVYKNGEWQLLTAPQGESACKLGVDQSYTILSERESIKTHYPDFVEWATLNTISKWW